MRMVCGQLLRRWRTRIGVLPVRPRHRLYQLWPSPDSIFTSASASASASAAAIAAAAALPSAALALTTASAAAALAAAVASSLATSTSRHVCSWF